MKLKIDSYTIIVLIIILLIIVSIARFSINRKNSREYQLGKIIEAPPLDYTSLFPNDKLKLLSFAQNYQTETGNVISKINYGQDYFIIVTLIDSIGDKSLKKFISFDNNRYLKVQGVGYYPFGNEILGVKFRGVFPKFPGLVLNLYGKSSNNVVVNDTVMALSSNFKTLSIRSSSSDTSAIYSTSNGLYPDIPINTVPINILFMKKNKKLYFLILSVNDKNVNLKQDALYKLILGK